MDTFAFGALAPKTDLRDYSIAAGVVEYPESYSLDCLPPIKNQKSVSSCVAHATSSILEYFIKKEFGEHTSLSTDFIYGMQGVALGRLEGGMYLRDACKIVNQYGDCKKDTISTNTEQPKCTENLKNILNEDIYKEAFDNHVASYAKCKDDNAIKHAIMNYGPVLASIKWYKKYTKENNNVIRMDKTSSYGYHAIMVYGWNKDGWLCQNSWGKSWNGDGRFVFPYEDGFREAWSFIDAVGENVKKPKRNKFFNIIYRILNSIINFIKGKIH